MKKEKLNRETRDVIKWIRGIWEQCKDGREIMENLETLTMMISGDFFARIDWRAVILAEREYWTGA